jgi:hypothetical protein
MRSTEHAWLVEQAKAHRTTLNAEIMWRVMRTREQDADLELHMTAESVRRALEPYLLAAHERSFYGDLITASRQLVDLVAPLLAARLIDGKAGQQLRAAIDNFHLARHGIEIAAGEKLANRGTTGFAAAADQRVKAAGGSEP